jgi:hypothetical protein
MPLRSIFKKETSQTFVEVPEHIPKTYEKDLCNRCKAIDFHKILSVSKGLSTKSWGRIVAGLGCVDDSQGQDSCPFCRLLSSLRVDALDSQIRPEYVLWAFPSITACPSLLWKRDTPYTDMVVLGVVPTKDGIVLGERIDEACRKKGYITVVPPQSFGHLSFCGRIVSKRADYSLLRRWLSHCERNHGEDCRSQDVLVIGPLKVIDCNSGRVIPTPKRCLYAALSYVWGSSMEGGTHQSKMKCKTLHTISKRISGITLPAALPKVISDAIMVTTNLGLRYLWADRYCIDQSNAKEKHDQIHKMDQIYRAAYVSIIAAAGRDEKFGLPGVSTTPRKAQPIAQIKGIRFASTMPHPLHTIRESNWFSRGWTYQEAVLPGRCIFFTEEQAYFACNRGDRYEAIDKSDSISDMERDDEDHLRQAFRETVIRKLAFRGLSTGYVGNLQQFMKHVEKYTARTLRFGSDSLNAFAGILRLFETAYEPVYNFWGLPVVFDTQLRQFYSFTASLLWEHRDTSRPISRRPDFPSWSWAGWDGEVAFKSLSWTPIQRANCQSRIVTYWVGTQYIRSTRLQTYIMSKEEASEVPFHLWVRAQVLHCARILDCDVTTFSVRETSPRSFPVYIQTERALPHPKSHRTDPGWLCYVETSQAIPRAEFFEKIKSQQMECLILGSKPLGSKRLGSKPIESGGAFEESAANGTPTYVMLVEHTHTGTVRRAGLMTVENMPLHAIQVSSECHWFCLE